MPCGGFGHDGGMQDRENPKSDHPYYSDGRSPFVPLLLTLLLLALIVLLFWFITAASMPLVPATSQ